MKPAPTVKRRAPAFEVGARLRVVGERTGRYLGIEGRLTRINYDLIGAKPSWVHDETYPYGIDVNHVPGLQGVRFFGRSEVEEISPPPPPRRSVRPPAASGRSRAARSTRR